MQLYVCLHSLKSRKVSQHYYLPLLSRTSQRGALPCEGWGLLVALSLAGLDVRGKVGFGCYRDSGAVLLKVFQKFCLTLPEL